MGHGVMFTENSSLFNKLNSRHNKKFSDDYLYTISMIKSSNNSSSDMEDKSHPKSNKPTYETITIDSRKNGNISRFINHSCIPNAMFYHIFSEDRTIPFVGIFAIRDIEPNSEILIDYGDEFWQIKGKQKMFCECGLQECRFPALGDSRRVRRKSGKKREVK